MGLCICYLLIFFFFVSINTFILTHIHLYPFLFSLSLISKDVDSPFKLDGIPTYILSALLAGISPFSVFFFIFFISFLSFMIGLNSLPPEKVLKNASQLGRKVQYSSYREIKVLILLLSQLTGTPKLALILHMYIYIY